MDHYTWHSRIDSPPPKKRVVQRVSRAESRKIPCLLRDPGRRKGRDLKAPFGIMKNSLQLARVFHESCTPKEPYKTFMSQGKTASGVIWNWIALASSFAVSFFLSPFIVHHLGTVLYGVWTLVAGLTSYM